MSEPTLDAVTEAAMPDDVIVTQADKDALENLDDALGFLMNNEREIVVQALARHRIAAEAQREAEIVALRSLVDQAEAIFRECSVEAGYCCCGDKSDTHTIGTGHAPVDMGGYMVQCWRDEYSAIERGEHRAGEAGDAD